MFYLENSMNIFISVFRIMYLFLYSGMIMYFENNIQHKGHGLAGDGIYDF